MFEMRVGGSKSKEGRRGRARKENKRVHLRRLGRRDVGGLRGWVLIFRNQTESK